MVFVEKSNQLMKTRPLPLLPLGRVLASDVAAVRQIVWQLLQLLPLRVLASDAAAVRQMARQLLPLLPLRVLASDVAAVRQMARQLLPLLPLHVLASDVAAVRQMARQLLGSRPNRARRQCRARALLSHQTHRGTHLQPRLVEFQKLLKLPHN